jgi:hypothetical protein
LLVMSFTLQAQEKQKADCNCPEPEKVDYSKMCAYSKDQTKSTVKGLNYLFEEQLLKMSCVDLRNDSRETIIEKVNCMWNKYKTKFACDSLGFNVPNGNILKFCMNFNFSDFIYTLVDKYGLDVMFVDPADKLTFIGYLNQEINKTSLYGSGKIMEMEEVKRDVTMEMKYNPVEQLFEPVK